MITRTYRVSTDQSKMNLPWICETLQKQYWGHWLNYHRVIESMQHSVCFGLFEDGGIEGGSIVTYDKQVGFARVVSDYATFSSLMDVVIQKELRSKGLGKLLMKAVMAHPAVYKTQCVLSTKDAHHFYNQFGFAPIEAMKKNPGK